MSKKPSAAAIFAELQLSERPERGEDAILVCNICGREVDPSDLPLTLWREHDEHDLPIAGASALVFIGQGRDHASCRRVLEKHSRLYAEAQAQPGHFPSLCGPCVHRGGLACSHPDLKANGGAGLLITLDGLASMIICSRGRRRGCDVPVRNAVRCAGRRTLRVLEGGQR